MTIHKGTIHHKIKILGNTDSVKILLLWNNKTSIKRHSEFQYGVISVWLTTVKRILCSQQLTETSQTKFHKQNFTNSAHNNFNFGAKSSGTNETSWFFG